MPATPGRVVHLYIGESARPVACDISRVVVDLLAGQLAAPRDAKRGDAPVRVCGRRREHLEFAAAHEIRDVHELERHAQVRLVAAEAAHGIGISQARERVGQLDLQHAREYVADEPFHQRHDLLLRQERGLDVELRELGLPVGAQVLVPEAAHDLVVAVEAAHHQELLEDLRRLRQREELAGVRARGHEVVARAFGRRLGQHRRLDVHEVVAVEVFAHRARDRVTPAQALLHHVAAQVDVAVLEPQLLADLLVERERRRCGRVQHDELRRQQFDLPGTQPRVGRARRARAHLALHLDAELAAEVLGGLEGFGGVRVEHDLKEPRSVAQVDEDDAAVVAPAVHPAGHLERAARQGFADFAAIVGAHGRGQSARCYVPGRGRGNRA